MDKKKLAGLVKEVRSVKLKEVIGVPDAYNPVHYKATHGEDPESPNQYKGKKVVKEYLSTAIAKGNLGNLANRQGKTNARSRPLGGPNAMKARHFDEDKSEIALGKTDTNKPGETVDVSPEKKELKGQLK